MNNRNLLYLAITVVLSFGVTPGFSQTWEKLNSKTEECFNKRDLDSALVYANRALKKAEAEYGPEHKNYVISLSNLADIFWEQENFAAAEPLFKQALEILKKSVGKDHPDYATSLVSLAGLYKDMGDYAAAQHLLKEALAIRKIVLGQENPGYLNLLNNQGLLYLYMGNYAAAQPILEEVAEIRKKVLGEEDPDYAQSLNNLAGVYCERGNYPAAEPLFKLALEIRKKVLPKEHPDYAVTLNGLGMLYYSTGNYAAAEPLIKKSLEIREKVFGKEHRSYATSLNNLGLLYCSMGNYSAAEPLLRRALEIGKKVLGEEHPDYVNSLNNLGMLYDLTGNYFAAESLYQQALAIRKKVLGAGHPDYATSLNNLAGLYVSMGNYAAAEPLYQQALEIRKNVLGEKNSDYASSLNNLAVLYESMDNYMAAEPLYKQAMKIFRKTLGKAHPSYASSLNNLAEFYSGRGNYTTAEPLYRQALEIRKKNLGVAHPDYGQSLNNLAVLYNVMGNYAAAEPLFKEALEIRKKGLGVEHPDYAQSLNNLAGLYQNNGQPAKAEPLILEANSILMNQLNKGYQFLSETEAQLYYSSVSDQFEMNNSFIAGRQKASPSLAIQSLNNELALKGATLASSIRMRQAVLESGDSIVVGTFNQWIGVKEQINFLYNRPVEKRYANMDSLEGVANTLEKELIRKSQVFGNMQSSLGIQWKEVQKGLSENEAAVELINFRHYNGKKLTDSTLYAALIVRPGYEYPRFVSLFEGKQLFDLLNYTDEAKDRFFRKSYTPEILKEVYKLTWQPLEEYLTGVNTVFLSTSGLLTTVPFQALMKSNTNCLIDSLDIHYLLSTRELAIEKPMKESAEPLTAALFGGIRYDLDTAFLVRDAMRGGVEVTRSYLPDDSTRGGRTFGYLEGTREEVIRVNGYLTDNYWKTELDTGSLATEGQFKRLSGKNAPTILHLATHGFYFPPRETKERELMQFSMDKRFRVADNPLRRTGLIMAGGNLAWKGLPLPEGVEDGILTAYEISNMDLRKTGLVVLSACETGLGDIKRGEGVFGLQRAF
ncbi:MAG: tetratricopeptide repeat protein, partial [Bacteroidia bacterium]|nr:tetratricopeptide repeat protein [Bacteroidia bacterium]